MWRGLLILFWLASMQAGTPASAEEIIPGATAACRPARADVVNVQIEDIHYGMTQTYVWASGTVRLQLKNHSEERYAIEGRAVPIRLPLQRNRSDASFGYPGFQCIVASPFMVSVRNCRSGVGIKACDVGIAFAGGLYSFAVSLTADRVR